VVTEVMEPERVAQVAQHCDLLQIGARNVQNFPLLRAVARAGKPVLLKRGMATTLEEWLLSAEYVLDGGNPDVILCKRGIRSFDPATRFTLDLCAVPVLEALTHLPVVVDPSHGTGRWDCIEPMSVAAGADGLLIEVHGQPDRALCDGAQSIKPTRFVRLMQRLRAVTAAVDREL
jgi:3-deoxy-7-phosphoheptulonate synthase